MNCQCWWDTLIGQNKHTNGEEEDKALLRLSKLGENEGKN